MKYAMVLCLMVVAGCQASPEAQEPVPVLVSSDPSPQTLDVLKLMEATTGDVKVFQSKISESDREVSRLTSDLNILRRSMEGATSLSGDQRVVRASLIEQLGQLSSRLERLSEIYYRLASQYASMASAYARGAQVGRDWLNQNPGQPHDLIDAVIVCSRSYDRSYQMFLAMGQVLFAQGDDFIRQNRETLELLQRLRG